MTDWKRFVARPAGPTLLLSGVLVASTVAIWASTRLDLLPLWAGGLLMLFVDYWWFTPLHEASHGNVGGRSGASALDEVVGWTAALAFVAPFPAFRLLHLRHHGRVNETDEDPDLWVAGSNLFFTVIRCLTLIPYYYVFLFGKLREESARKRRIAWVSAFGLVACALLAAGLTWLGWGREVLFLWLIPGWLATAILGFLFDYLPHHPHEEQGRWTNASIRVGGSLLTVLMAGQNYHLVHHLFPRVPFYRYGDLYRDLRPELAEHGSTVLGDTVT